MKTKLIILTLGLILIIGCSKTSDELFNISNENLKNEKIDDAISNLQKLVLKYPQDSLASQAQFKIATIHLNWKNSLTDGYEALQKTVNQYSETVHAKEAQKQIDEFPGFILNKTESLRKRKMVKEALDHLSYLIEKYSKHELSAKGQYMLGDIYMNDLRDFNTAIQEYRKVIDNYSGSEQEPHALFMIGYIFANVVNDPKSAEVEYNLFLDKFPSHELSPSVRFELDYLGKNIEEIPALKHITS